MPYTDAGKNTMLDALAPDKVSLHTAEPNAEGSNEVAGGEYERKSIEWNAASVDPDEPLFRVLTPSGDLSDLEVVRVSKGIFRCLFEHDEPGEHVVLYLGKGAHRIGGEVRYRVRTPRVSRD